MHFYIADTHFGHNNIIDLCNRPFSTSEEMDAFMIACWQNKVRPQDDVFILGDFAYRNKASFISYLEQLPGHKHLIYGNHDKVLLRIPSALEYFASVQPMLELLDPELGVNVMLCHYPMAEWPGFFNGAYHIYGHLHNVKNTTYYLMRQVERALNASAEIVMYEPVTLSELISCNQKWLDSDAT